VFDHFGNGLVRTTDPENLGVDTISIIFSHVLVSYGQKWNFDNGRLNLHITQNAQGCQGGIIKILDQRPSEKRELQKTL